VATPTPVEFRRRSTGTDTVLTPTLASLMKGKMHAHLVFCEFSIDDTCIHVQSCISRVQRTREPRQAVPTCAFMHQDSA
jgi:hypothetical protein